MELTWFFGLTSLELKKKLRQIFFTQIKQTRICKQTGKSIWNGHVVRVKCLSAHHRWHCWTVQCGHEAERGLERRRSDGRWEGKNTVTHTGDRLGKKFQMFVFPQHPFVPHGCQSCHTVHDMAGLLGCSLEDVSTKSFQWGSLKAEGKAGSSVLFSSCFTQQLLKHLYSRSGRNCRKFGIFNKS